MLNRKFLLLGIMLLFGLLFSFNSKGQEIWPPALPSANKNGVATLSIPEFLKVPVGVQRILDSTSNAKLTLLINSEEDEIYNGFIWKLSS